MMVSPTKSSDSLNNTPNNQPKRKCNEMLPEDISERTDLVGKIAVKDLMKMMETVIEAKLINVSTKSDIDEIKHQIIDVDNKFESLKQENIALRDEIEQLKVERKKDQQQINRLVEQGKRKNVIFRGIEKKDTPRESVEAVCKNVLKLQNITVNAARIIYTASTSKISVVAELETVEMANSIFKNLKELAGSTIKVEKDLTEEKQQDRKVMFQLKTDILEISKTHKVLVKNDSIKVGTSWLYWDRNRQLMCGQQNAAEVLTKLYGDNINKVSLNYETLFEKINQKINQKN